MQDATANTADADFAAPGTTAAHPLNSPARLTLGRTQGDQFMDQYFLNSSTTYSTIVGELVGCSQAGQH